MPKRALSYESNKYLATNPPKRVKLASFKDRILAHLKGAIREIVRSTAFKLTPDIWDVICGYCFCIQDNKQDFDLESVTHMRTEGTLKVSQWREMLFAPYLQRLECCESYSHVAEYNGAPIIRKPEELNISWMKSKLWHRVRIAETVTELAFRRTNFNSSLAYLPNLRNLCFYEIDLNDWSTVRLPENLEHLHIISCNFSAPLGYLPNLNRLSIMDVKSGSVDWTKVTLPSSLESLFLCKSDYPGSLEGLNNLKTLCMYGVRRDNWDDIIVPKCIRTINLEWTNFKGDPQRLKQHRTTYLCVCKVAGLKGFHCCLHYDFYGKSPPTPPPDPLRSLFMAQEHGKRCSCELTEASYRSLFPGRH